MRFIPTLLPSLVLITAMSACVTPTARAEEPTLPAISDALEVAPAAAYPRGVATEWTASVRAGAGATFRLTSAGSDLTTGYRRCATDFGADCTVDPEGQVQVAPAVDGAPATAGVVTVTGTARPAVTVPLVSTEGTPMQPATRVLRVEAAATGSTTGSVTPATAQVHVVTNPDSQAVLELVGSSPAAGTTAVRGGVVPYRATITRTGNLAQETAVTLRLVPGTGGASGTSTAGSGFLVIAPGVSRVTVQLSVTVDAAAIEGTATWHLQARWGVDSEDGLDRSFAVPPAAPPALDPPGPAPSPAALTPAPGPTMLDTPAPPAPPTPQRDTKRPAVGIRLVTPTVMLVRPGVRPRIKLRYACPKDERSCTMQAAVTWRPRARAPLVTLGSSRVRLVTNRAGTTTLLLSTGARRYLRERGVLRIMLRVTAIDAAGNRSAGHLPIVVRLDRRTP